MFNNLFKLALMASAALGLRFKSKAPVMPTKSWPTLDRTPVTQPRGQRNTPRKRRHSSPSRKPNGAQECARRMRQIARGQLAPSNGLLIIAAERFHANSHGEMQHFY